MSLRRHPILIPFLILGLSVGITLLLWADARKARASFAAQARVTPDANPTQVLASETRTVPFLVENIGDATGIFTLTPTCSGAAIVSGCNASQASVTLAAGTSTTVTVGFTSSATLGATGTIELLAREGLNVTLQDFGSHNITVGQPGAEVTPDNGTATAWPSEAGQTTTFTVRNSGNAFGDYDLTVTCTGSGVPSCSVSPNTIQLAAGAQTTVTVTYTGGATSGTTGTIELRARHITLTSITDIGSRVVTVQNAPSITVTASPTSQTVPPATSGRWASFILTNPGTAAGTYNITHSCAGAAIATSPACTLAAATVTIAAGGTVRDSVQFTSGPHGTNGSVTLTAVLQTRPTVTASATQTVNSTGTPGVDVTSPDHPGGTSSHPPTTAGQRVIFTVANSGTAPGTFALTPICAAAVATGCPAPHNRTISPGSPIKDTVTFTSGALNATGTIKLAAVHTTTSTITDTASINVSIVGTPIVQVDPAVTPITPIASTANHVGVFNLSNTGNASGSFNISVLCSGTGIATGSCVRLAGSPRTLAAGVANTPDTVRFTSGASGTTGTIRLIAAHTTNASIVDTAFITVNPTSTVFNVDVTAPSGNAQPLASSTGRTYQFSVLNTGNATGTFNFTATCTPPGAAATPCTLSAASLSIAASNYAYPVVTYTSGAAGTTGSIKLLAVLQTNTTIRDSVTITVSPQPPTPLVAVTPKPGSAGPLTPSLPNQLATFFINNPGNVAGTYNLTFSCTGAAVTNCTHGQTSMTVNPNQPKPDTVRFSSGSASASGVIKIIATLSTNPAVKDSGWYNVTTNAGIAQAPAMSWNGLNKGVNQPRSQCVTVALGSGAAAECGALRVVHGVSSLRRLSRSFGLSLVYNSETAAPSPSVRALVSLGAQTKVPNTVRVTLIDANSNEVRGRRKFPGSSWTQGGPPKLVQVRDTVAVMYPTGLVKYRLEVANQYGSSFNTTSDTLTTAVVNRSNSPYGAGWWLAGVEQLSPLPGGHFLWIGGDGSTRHYKAQGAVYTTQLVSAPDTIRAIPGGYRRDLPGGVSVEFDVGYRHTRTTNRMGQTTTFGYNGSMLYDVFLPLNKGQFTITWSLPVQYQISDGGRTTLVSLSSNQVTAIRDPDLLWTNFAYKSATQSLLTRRTDKRNAGRAFVLDSLRHVVRTSLTPTGGTSDSIVATLQPSESQGLATPVDTASVATVFTDGIGATTTLRINHHGAPTRITDAIGGVTTLARGNPTYPGLVTQLTTASGQQSTATYDTRGRVTTVVDNTWQNATTTFGYGVFDQLTSTTGPSGESVTFALNGDGNPTSKTTNLATTTFSYDPIYKTLASVGGAGAHAVNYQFDVYGNVNRVTTALGFVTNITNDIYGRPTQVAEPLETTVTGYDPMDRVTSSTRSGGGQSIGTTNIYDGEGNLLSVTGASAPQSWAYDLAGRQTSATSAGTTETRTYDAAGRVTQLVTRRGHTINMGYDNLGRLTSRTYPSVAYPTRTDGIWTWQTVFGGGPAGDTETFTYNLDGQILTANNSAAQVTRQYNGAGLMTSEQLVVGPKSYTTGYAYDLSKRRTTLTLPSQFVGGGVGSTIQYGYYPWGGLQTVTDPSGNVFGYGYNPRGEPATLTRPGGITENWNYDGDGRVTSNTMSTSSFGAFPKFPNATMRNTSFTSYDARGKLLAASDPTTYQDQITNTYSGLGYLLSTTMSQRAYTVLGNLPIVTGTSETSTFDNLGRILSNSGSSVVQINGQLAPGGGGWGSTRTYDSNGRQTSEGYTGGGVKNFEYDGAGNNYWSKLLGTATTPGEHRYMMYDALDRLRSVSRAWVSKGGVIDFSAEREEGGSVYVYDALGRRVVAGSNLGCTYSDYRATSCNLLTYTWTVWDGSNELMEIRPADPNNDLSLANIPATSQIDQNQMYGRVIYTHGTETDRPLSITRSAYTDWNGSSVTAWNPFVLVPLWNYRSQALVIAFSDGNRAKQFTPGGTDCALTGAQRCIGVVQPGAWSAWDQKKFSYPDVWHGSLLEDKSEGAVGLTYRRNRYYDQQSGRFTQEDPIGLAGGLNLYGFANGDPINFADPFGLNPCLAGPVAATACAVGFGAIKLAGTPAGRVAIDRTTTAAVAVGTGLVVAAASTWDKVVGAVGKIVDWVTKVAAGVTIATAPVESAKGEGIVYPEEIPVQQEAPKRARSKKDDEKSGSQ